MAGPTPEELEIGTEMRRRWTNRWSISRDGLETLVHVLRRNHLEKLEVTREKLLKAFDLPGPS